MFRTLLKTEKSLLVLYICDFCLAYTKSTCYAGGTRDKQTLTCSVNRHQRSSLIKWFESAVRVQLQLEVAMATETAWSVQSEARIVSWKWRDTSRIHSKGRDHHHFNFPVMTVKRLWRGMNCLWCQVKSLLSSFPLGLPLTSRPTEQLVVPPATRRVIQQKCLFCLHIYIAGKKTRFPLFSLKERRVESEIFGCEEELNRHVGVPTPPPTRCVMSPTPASEHSVHCLAMLNSAPWFGSVPRFTGRPSGRATHHEEDQGNWHGGCCVIQRADRHSGIY